MTPPGAGRAPPDHVRGRLSPFRGGHRIWLAAWRWQHARRLRHLAPRAGRGRFASGALAKRSKSGEGACPQAQTRGYAPSPGFLPCAPDPTSPRPRGEVAQAALPRTSRYQLKCDCPAARGAAAPATRLKHSRSSQAIDRIKQTGFSNALRPYRNVTLPEIDAAESRQRGP